MKAGQSIHLLAYASGIAGAAPSSAEGPILLQKSAYFSELGTRGLGFHWQHTLLPDKVAGEKFTAVAKLCHELANYTADCVRHEQPFAVFGGDHTSAIGTWSGVAHAKRAEGPVGLIWVDAHMDSHTPQTSLSGNLHGMPVASLLGYGDERLTQILDDLPKIKPEHICLIGVRSFEEGEAALLKRLNVKIFYMDEVKKRGLQAVFAEAVKIVSHGTSGFGLSIDIDSLDPSDAPGTGVAEPDGLSANELCQVLRQFAREPRLIGFEIAEFDPSRDVEHKTERLIPQLVSAITLGQ